jgi:membrane associated rhomboid family serine protease
MWGIHILSVIFRADLGNLGIHPRDINSLPGILLSPLVHGSWEHLLSNTLPLLILGIILFLIYDKAAMKIWWLNYFFTGTLVWLFARDSYHIGASGIIYGLASFLLFSGFFRMDVRSIAIASGVAIFYGGMVWGILPIQPGVSWESHLFGGIVGIVLAFFFRNKHKDEVVISHESENSDRKTFDEFLKKHLSNKT